MNTIQVSKMKTIISATTSNSILNDGIYFDSGIFYDKFKNVLDTKWVKYCYWTNVNSRYGSNIATERTNKFCKQYNISI